MTKPDYSLHDPKGWCGDPKRGAAMGRGHWLDEPDDFTGVIHVSPLRIDDGYDVNGTYFGIGDPLYWIATDSCSIDYVVRACSRAAVKAKVLERWPAATIHWYRNPIGLHPVADYANNKPAAC
jgi:hypothetical protein